MSPCELIAGPGGGASSRNPFRNGSTPKFVSALPKKTGVRLAGEKAVAIELGAGAVSRAISSCSGP